MPAGLERRGADADGMRQSMLHWLVYAVGKDPHSATRRDWYQALTLALRERVVDRWMETTRNVHQRGQKRVYYLSMEFLIGRLLESALGKFGLLDTARQALADVGVPLDEVLEAEPDAALGNGGLGRLAACFLDSMANLGIAGYGYGIRYQYGMFRQAFEDGRQVELPEEWLNFGNPWEFERPEVAYPIDFYGRVEARPGSGSDPRQVWRSGQRIVAVAYDVPVVGWQGRSVNTLRLWSAKPIAEFNLEAFNRGDHMSAVAEAVSSKSLSRVLYPADNTPIGQELRFRQEYFFCAASVQDMLRRYLKTNDTFDGLPDSVAIQLNDTHPAIAVAELMRLLVDRHDQPWERAWELCRGCFGYTNHTLLPEALETWPVEMIDRVLPRHMQIIYEINSRFLSGISQKKPAKTEHLSAVSLIDEHHGRRVRMANLAFLGSHKVNGVSALHTDLMRQTVFRDLHQEFPDRITNKTNGITPRRWLHQCNRPLADLVTRTIGEGWVGDLEQIAALEPYADDAGFRDAFAQAKRQNKEKLAAYIRRTTAVSIDPSAMFDIQIKRIHEYKRQLLNILHAVVLYGEMRDGIGDDRVPRVKLFGGKAASAYVAAKQILHLANDVSRTINADPAVRDRLKMLFLPNYNVSLAERMIPAADLSEQISTAGMEASGTGNMKFALNGALTIGTLDGANVEIREHVGADNIVIFGLTAPEVAAIHDGSRPFDPAATIAADPRLDAAVRMIADGAFSPEEPDRYRPLIDDLTHRDRFLVTADFAAYCAAQDNVDNRYRQWSAWLRSTVLNTARTGWFSSDRTVRDYAEEIWDAMPSAEPSTRAAE